MVSDSRNGWHGGSPARDRLIHRAAGERGSLSRHLLPFRLLVLRRLIPVPAHPDGFLDGRPRLILGRILIDPEKPQFGPVVAEHVRQFEYAALVVVERRGCYLAHVGDLRVA